MQNRAERCSTRFGIDQPGFLASRLSGNPHIVNAIPASRRL